MIDILVHYLRGTYRSDRHERRNVLDMLLLLAG